MRALNAMGQPTLLGKPITTLATGIRFTKAINYLFTRAWLLMWYLLLLQ
jgi:multisubunit Na+/H+ antiporter MnhG subunit